MALLRNAAANSLKFVDKPEGTEVQLCDGTRYGFVNLRGEFEPDAAFAPAEKEAAPVDPNAL